MFVLLIKLYLYGTVWNREANGRIRMDGKEWREWIRKDGIDELIIAAWFNSTPSNVCFSPSKLCFGLPDFTRSAMLATAPKNEATRVLAR
jgi:hypothetical protein